MRIQTSSFTRRPVLDNRVETAESQGAYAAAQGVSQFSETTAKLVERNQRLLAAADLTELKAGMATWLSERENSGDIDDLPNRLSVEMSARFEQIKKQGGFYAQTMQEHMPVVKAELSGLAETAVVNATLSKNREAVEKIIANTTVLTRGEPQNMEANIESAKTQINEAFLPPDEKRRLIEKARRDIAFTAANEALASNPAGLRKAIRAGVFKDYLGVDEQQRFLRACVEQAGAVRTDAATYEYLTRLKKQGRNIEAQARTALLSGKLTISDFDKLADDENRKRMMAYLHGVAAQGWVRDPALNFREQEAVRAADRWLEENPYATPSQIDDRARGLVRDYQLNKRAKVADVLAYAERSALIRAYYAPSDKSNPFEPTVEGLIQSVRRVSGDNTLDDKQKARILAAFEEEINTIERNKEQNGTGNGGDNGRK